MTDIEETGTIAWFLIEAPRKELNGELVAPLLDLVDRRLIRIIDALVLVKREEGDVLIRFDSYHENMGTRTETIRCNR